MILLEKRILIIDEAGFSRVCAAILEFEGYRAQTLTSSKSSSPISKGPNQTNVGLIITSYPFCVFIIEDIKVHQVPLIILSDHINNGLLHLLEYRNDSYCMIKPLDYQKFKFLVKGVMNGDMKLQNGYCLV
jgi:hypothetical protein